MVRRTFFSFHYERDIWRASIVRNSWVTQERKDAGFWDESLWEEAKKKGDEAIKKMIDEALIGTSVTVVLIGAETYQRKWVRYEIKKSYEKGNGLLGIYIHKIKDADGKTEPKGNNPFDYIYVERDGKKVYLSKIYQTYDWADDNGYDNMGNWIEKAAKDAGK